jgi:menaquinone-9 beta-reductase
VGSFENPGEGQGCPLVAEAALPRRTGSGLRHPLGHRQRRPPTAALWVPAVAFRGRQPPEPMRDDDRTLNLRFEGQVGNHTPGIHPMLYDVIIAGAGPAGLSTALFLLHARPRLQGRVVVLEKKSFPREKICAGALGGRGDRLLESIGVRVEVPSVPISGIRFTVPQGTSERLPGPIGRTVRRLEFDAALANLARARGVLLVESAPVRDVRPSRRGVEVTAGEEVYEGRVLVGADGLGSFVRRWLGLSFAPLKARVVEVDSERVKGDPPPSVLHFDVSHRRLNGYTWDFPTPLEGQVRMSRGVYGLVFPGDDPPDVAGLLDRRLERLGLDPGAHRKRQMMERGFEAHQPFSRGRVLLVGEAAGVDPITGEGIAEAIQYGAVAGAYLAEKIHRSHPDFTDWRRHLLRSPVGADLILRRWGASLCFRHARRPVELLFAHVPWILDVAAGLFAGSMAPGTGAGASEST